MSLLQALPEDKMKPCLIGKNGNAFVIQLWDGQTFSIGDDSESVSAIDFLNEVINVPGNQISDISGLQALLNNLQLQIDNIQLTPGATGLKGDKGDTGAPGPQGATGAKGDKGDPGIDTANVTVTGGTISGLSSLGAQNLNLNRSGANEKHIDFQTDNVTRWRLTTTIEEFGANLRLQAFNNLGAYLFDCLAINRTNGQAVIRANITNDFAVSIENNGGSYTRQGLRIFAGNNNGQTTYLRFQTAGGNTANFVFDLPTETVSLDRRWSARGIRTDSYTLANLPAAASRERDLVYCSNLTGGAEYIYSDGTNWRRMSDRTIAD